MKYFSSNFIDQGDGFGEIGLIRDIPRTSTVLCLEPCIFGVLDKINYDQILSKLEHRKMNKKFEFFNQTILKNIERSFITKFLYLSKNIKFSFGELV